MVRPYKERMASPGQDRNAKNAKLAAIRGYACQGDYSEPPPKRRMTMPVEIQ